MRVRILILIILFPFWGVAQSERTGNPGYMGKHFIVSAEGSFSGSIFILNEYWIKYCGSTEMILGKHFSLGASFMHSKINTSQYPKNDNSYSYPTFTFNTNAYSLDFYFYGSGTIAPLGSFSRLQFTYYGNYTNDFYQDKHLFENQDPYSAQTYPPGSDSLRSYNLGASIFFGQKRIFFNSLVVSYGMQIGLTIHNPLTYLVKDNHTVSEDISFYKATCYENFYSSFLVLKLTIGGIW